MENYPQLVPLVILIPAVGAFINIFWGAQLGERMVAIIGTTAAALAFVVSVLLFSYLAGSGYEAAVVNPPLLDGWIRLPGVEIPWQMRVDSLSVTMMLVVTGVGTLIHLYSAGYMHGDARFHRFFAYLNMFLAFMLILVTGNNFLMMFVGWEGVGLCSFLLIGFWFDKTRGVGWRNSNAARKAFIVNRIGDFGLIMAIFLIFWTFGTLDYFKPGEIANVELAEAMAAGGAHGEAEAGPGEEAALEDETATEGEVIEEGAAPAEGEAVEGEAAVTQAETGEEGAVVVEGEGEGGHGEAGEEGGYVNNEHIPTEQLGVFGQFERMRAEGHQVDFGPFSLPIETVITLITLFLLIGATGKSAQIPLFVWLPDAMAGPTPVSALIHAATMVTAGVYLMVRSNVFFYYADLTSFIVTLIGVGTAVVGGFVAIGQWDIKRVLAYSTVSQLGFMVAAVGIGAYGAAMFHLVTHAFFKALLFLGSGSVIHGVEHGHHIAHGAHHGHDHDAHDTNAHDDAHALEHEHGEEHQPTEEFDPQDMRNMGGLSKRMPITYWTYVIGTLALAGIWPLAGFWSKDEILVDSWLAGLFDNDLGGYIALVLLLGAAGLTAFYMWRQVEMVFHGRPRTDAAANAPESAWTMTVPLIVLAVLSVVGGFINIPGNAGLPSLGLDGVLGLHQFTTFLEYSVSRAHAAEFNPVLALVAVGLALTAIFLARSIYGGNRAVTADRHDPFAQRPGVAPVWSLANARLYWDETYFRLFENPFNRAAKFMADVVDWRFWHDYFHDGIIGRGFNALGRALANPVDVGLIDGVVMGVGRVISAFASQLRRVQTGYVRVYAVSLLLGVVLVILILLFPLIQRALAAGG